MNFRPFLGILRFTFNEAIRKGTMIFFLVCATLINLLFLFALSVGTSDNGQTMYFFGNAIKFPGDAAVLSVANILLIHMEQTATFWVLLFGTFATAGLIPSMLEKGTSEVFLSKPVPRVTLFFGRVTGAFLVVALGLVYFVAGMFTVLGVKTGIWHWQFLLSSLVICYAFFCAYSITAISSLMTRSSGLSIMITFLFLLVSAPLEARERSLYLIWDSAVYHRILDGIYYILPLFDAMTTNASRIIGVLPFDPNPGDFTVVPFLISLVSAGTYYGLAVYYFYKQDY